MTPSRDVLEVAPATGRGDIEAFIRFPFRLYAGSPHWVPPLLMERRSFLDRRKNPVFEYAEVQLYLARRGAEAVGTIAAVRNDRYGQFHPEDAHVGFFGLYECVDDAEVSRALLSAAADWLKGQGRTVMRGPVNLTTNDVVGLLVEGFDDDPVLLMPYNPPYYASQFESFGLAKVKDLVSFEMRSEHWSGQWDDIVARILERGRISIRPVNLSRWRDELEFVRRCYNEAWKDNWGFVPWTDRELAYIAKELKPLVDPRLALVLEVDGQPAGFAISVPDANQALKLARGRLFPLGLLRILWKMKVRGCDRLRTIALGILPAHRRLGLDAVLIHRTIHNGLPLGYRRSELGWILEDNEAMLRPLRKLGATRTKTFRVYDRRL